MYGSSPIRSLLALVLVPLTGWGCRAADGATVDVRKTPAAAGVPDEEVGRFGRSGTDRHARLFGTGHPAEDVHFEGRAATDLQQHTLASEGADFDPDVDPTGRRLVFASTRHSPHSHLYTKAVDGATLTQITDEPADDVQPAFDPTGSRLAFASNRSGQWDIWVVDANGRSPMQITSSPAAELHPSWSPDGKRLVFCRLLPDDHRGELWLADVDNPGTKRFIGEGLFPEWSPNGDKIVYQRARARGSRGFSIWTLDIRQDEVLYPTEVAGNPRVALIAPTWSPDATQIAFAAVAADEGQFLSGGGTEICVVDTDGRCLQRLSGGRGENYSPTWSADGRIYFTARMQAGETIWSIKPFQPAPVTEPAAPTGDRRAAAVEDASFEE